MKPAWNEQFDQYTNHVQTFQKNSNDSENKNNFIDYLNSDLGRSVEFQRIAVHYVVVPPGHRTSLPHAESLEEEFVFVVKGTPDLWLNGYIHSLKENFAVGFPAGTGIAHTFINNTDSEIHLLVAGDKGRKDNLCAFPVDPQMKEKCAIWWDNPPSHLLGPHSGLPGPVSDSERAKESSPFVIDCSIVERGTPFHYPGDNETFGSGFRITDKVGLKSLGIWFERLAPGRRSAFPHAHTHEEEFVFVVEGNPTLWMDGYTKRLNPQEFAAFPSNTGIAHTIMNETDQEVIYVCIGETRDFPDEKIHYPLNLLRQQECIRKKWAWTALEKRELGPHPGRPQNPIENHVQFRICSEADISMILGIFEKSPNYFLNVEGKLPDLEMVREALFGHPKNVSDKFFKEFLIIFWNQKPCGVLDLHIHHPEEGICYLGLFLIIDEISRQKNGTHFWKVAEHYIKRSLDCKKVRLGISAENDVTSFWLKLGFQPNGNSYSWQGKNKTSVVLEYDKDI